MMPREVGVSSQSLKGDVSEEVTVEPSPAQLWGENLQAGEPTNAKSPGQEGARYYGGIGERQAR